MLDAKIETLLIIAQTKSYTQAAERLHLTQPAVSHHIHQLESEYGIKIFAHIGRELHFTPEGKILYKHARQAYEIQEKAKQAIAGCKHNLRHLTIGITQSAGENSIPQMIARYAQVHPDSIINIVTDTINNLYARLDAYELDMIVVEGPSNREKYHSVLLDTDFLCVITAPEHPFASHASIKLEQLYSENLILRGSAAGTRSMFEHYLAIESETLQNFHVMMEVDNLATIKELVAKNYGISVVAYSACRNEVEAGILSAVSIENARMTRDICLLFRPDFSHAELMDSLRAIYQKLTSR